jgi:trehalose-phosphatase
VVSGRGVDDLLPLLGLDPPPEVWGAHGGQRLKDGRKTGANLPAGVEKALGEAEEAAARLGYANCLERKPYSLAVHWRGRPAEAMEEMRERITEKWRPLSRNEDLALKAFDGGLELRPPKITKAGAIQDLLAETQAPFEAAYLGDDETDEDAFAALGEKGLKVLVRNQTRPTRADIWLRPPEELLAFLEAWRTAEEWGRR